VKTDVHEHSKSIYNRIMKDGSRDARFKRVFEIIYFSPVPLTDYEILQRFKNGSDNINLVQPRITEGYKLDKNGNAPIYEEGPPGKSIYKNTPVRTTRIAHKPNSNLQESLF